MRDIINITILLLNYPGKNIFNNIIKYKTCNLYLRPHLKQTYTYEFLRPPV